MELEVLACVNTIHKLSTRKQLVKVLLVLVLLHVLFVSLENFLNSRQIVYAQVVLRICNKSKRVLVMVLHNVHFSGVEVTLELDFISICTSCPQGSAIPVMVLVLRMYSL